MTKGLAIAMSRSRLNLILATLLALNLVGPYPRAMAAEPPAATPVPEGLVSYKDLLARPHGAPDGRIAYGPAPQQYGDLWLPRGPGRHPVVVVLHGGCWLASLPSTELMDPMAEDLRNRGYAVWNLAYRRVGEAGGGYPGTFTDVGAGLDLLRTLARTHPLDLERVVVIGHSAGGHLAAWAVARDRLSRQSPLHVRHPLPLRGAVSLAGIPDLEFARNDGLAACDGPPTIDGLVGAASRPSQDVYADTSPARLLPFKRGMVMLSGALDPIVPPHYGLDFAARALNAGMPVQHRILPGAAHFELIDPKSAAWADVLTAIRATLKPPRPHG